MALFALWVFFLCAVPAGRTMPLLPMDRLPAGTHVQVLTAYPARQFFIQPHPRTLTAIRQILDKLPFSYDCILLVATAREAQTMRRWLALNRLRNARVVVAPADAPYSAWIRDSYISLEAPGRRLVIAQPIGTRVYQEAHRGDALTPAVVARLTGAPLYHSRIFFEGGNFLMGLASNGRRVVVSNARLVEINRSWGVSRDVVDRETRAMFGRTAILLPIVDPHVDTYVSFAPHGFAFVGDPRLALAHLSPDNFPHYAEAAAAVRRHGYAAKLDQTARILERNGFRVRRVPWLPQPPVDPTAIFLTYNNGVYLDRHTYLLPVYGLPTDRLARSILRSTGLRVFEVDVREMSWGGGALHCIMQAVGRD